MKKPSVAIVLGGGGMSKGMHSDAEDSADTDDESSGVKADAAMALKDALSGSDPAAITEAFEHMCALCTEG